MEEVQKLSQIFVINHIQSLPGILIYATDNYRIAHQTLLLPQEDFKNRFLFHHKFV